MREGQTESALSQSSYHQVKLLTQFQFLAADGLPASSGICVRLCKAKPVFFFFVFLFVCFILFLLLYFTKLDLFLFFPVFTYPTYAAVAAPPTFALISMLAFALKRKKKNRWPFGLKIRQQKCRYYAWYLRKGKTVAAALSCISDSDINERTTNNDTPMFSFLQTQPTPSVTVKTRASRKLINHVFSFIHSRGLGFYFIIFIYFWLCHCFRFFSFLFHSEPFFFFILSLFTL